MAELYNGIAMVGVSPPFTFGGCGFCNCGSTVVTTPGQTPNGPEPEPFCMIKLPAPERVTNPVKKHSFAPLFAKIVLFNVKEVSLMTSE